MKCHYCHEEVKKVTGKVIYPHRPDLHEKYFMYCEPCLAYCGTHKDGTPLGTVAKAPLRKLRNTCHANFDRLWKSGFMSRPDAYKWLQSKMNMTKEDAHIGKFNEEQCKKLLTIATGII